MNISYKNKLKVAIFFRKPSPVHFSLETLFAALFPFLNRDCKAEIIHLPQHSTGFRRRWQNAVFCMSHQGDISHISGDVHYIAILLKKNKTILTIHDLEILKRKKGIQRSIIKLFWFTLPSRRVSCITVISEATRKELLKYVQIVPEKVRVIHNCLPAPIVFQPKKFNAEKPVILQVGTKQNKNIPRLVEAIRNIPCILVILGKVSDSIYSLIEHSGIHTENYTNLSHREVMDLYSRCDMLAFVSTEEGFGIPILEAQATGRPVVTSNISSMPEVAGRGACLVDPFDKDAIKEGILKVIRNEAYREELIQQGLENIKRFEVSEIARQYTDLYREVWEKNKVKYRKM